MVSAKDLTAIKRILKGSIDAKCFQNLKGCEAVNACFNFQLTHETREHNSINLAPKCLPECRLMIKGASVCAGVHISHVDGGTLATKIRTLSEMGLQDYLQLMSQHGFMVKMEPGSFLMVPAGHMLTTFVMGDAAAEGLRWSFTMEKNATEHAQAKAAIDLLIKEHALSPEDPIHKLAQVLDTD